jgi:hypothetical protein
MIRDMNNNTQKLVSVFSQDELSAMMTAVAGYVNTKRKQGRSTGVEVQAFNKIVDALLVSNYLNAVEVDRVPARGRVGVAEYKMAEAMELA